MEFTGSVWREKIKTKARSSFNARSKKSATLESPPDVSDFSDEKMKSCSGAAPTTTNNFLASLLQSWKAKSGICNSQETSQFLRDFVAWEFNAFLWISLIAVTALLLRKVFKLFRLWAQARKIPGPPCNSFYGHSKLISRENLTGRFDSVGSFNYCLVVLVLKVNSKSVFLVRFEDVKISISS